MAVNTASSAAVNWVPVTDQELELCGLIAKIHEQVAGRPDLLTQPPETPLASQCGGCLAHWETDAVVTEQPAPAGGRVAVKWASAHLPGARAAITGINLFEPDEQVLRLGRLPVRTSRPGPAICWSRQRPSPAGGISADRLA
jgi:hypothetical protein